MSANAGYDLNLLAAAPATGAELQVHLFSASNRHTNNVFGFIGRVLESSGRGAIIFSRSLGWERKRDLHPTPSSTRAVLEYEKARHNHNRGQHCCVNSNSNHCWSCSRSNPQES